MKPSPRAQTVRRPRPPSRFHPSPWRLALCLALAGTILGGCGSDQPAEPTAAPATLAPTEPPAPTEVPPTDAATATALPPTAEAPTAQPTAIPATRAPQPTAAAPVSAATVAGTAAPAQPSAAPSATAAPAGAWSVEFYPDNWTYQLTKDQLCAGVNWKTVGVTELRFGAKDSSGEPVEAVGSRGNLCFKEDEAEFYLEYRKPDGQVERKILKLERDD